MSVQEAVSISRPTTTTAELVEWLAKMASPVREESVSVVLETSTVTGSASILTATGSIVAVVEKFAKPVKSAQAESVFFPAQPLLQRSARVDVWICKRISFIVEPAITVVREVSSVRVESVSVHRAN